VKILLTNKWMRNIGGSELVTLELAEWFQYLGHEVLIYTEQAGGALDITVPYTTKRPDTDGFDLLWIHHNMLIHDLGFRKRLSQRIVFNHMSSYARLEFPNLASYENVLADWILANSQETREALEWAGLREVELFQNPAPELMQVTYAGAHPQKTPVFVSNHMPSELRVVAESHPFVLRYGAQDNPERVNPTYFTCAKYVVANGKTVQYALRAGVPVYLYDHFGGCGWLTEENFAQAERFNFSGRGFGEEVEWKSEMGLMRSRMLKKGSDEIAEELATIPAPLPCPDRFKLEFRLKELGIV
jgi:hypothetical protein